MSIHQQLVWGARNNSLEIVTQALVLGAENNPLNQHDEAALWWAIYHENIPMVQLILETEIARHGLTRYLQIVRDPLVLAAWKNSTPILTLLLSSGNRGGKRLFYRYPKKAALSVATTFSDTKALALLVAHGLRIPRDTPFTLLQSAKLYEQLVYPQLFSINTMQHLLKALNLQRPRINFAQSLLIRPCPTSTILVEKFLRISSDANKLYKALIKRTHQYGIDEYRRREITTAYRPPLPCMLYNNKRLLTGERADVVFEWQPNL